MLGTFLAVVGVGLKCAGVLSVAGLVYLAGDLAYYYNKGYNAESVSLREKREKARRQAELRRQKEEEAWMSSLFGDDLIPGFNSHGEFLARYSRLTPDETRHFFDEIEKIQNDLR